MKRLLGILCGTVLAVLAGMSIAPAAAADTAATPAEMVATYNSLADTLLGAKHTEKNLVEAILATTYGHAEAARAEIKAKLKGGASARTEVERLAALVSQLGSEGDASVGAVRKRLLEGGHHHHASSADSPSEYEDGFVVVTRAAKKAFLESAGRIGKLAGAPDTAALDAEWAKVRAQYEALRKGAAR
jgi:hypothetical protein